MTDLKKFQIFLASPSDVAAERDLFSRVVEELNRTTAIPSGVFLELVRWETHTRPGISDDAQAVVNAQIGPRDLFVGIMWARFGTPTTRAQSGTEEEFERAYELWQRTRKPRIMLYFKTQPFFPKNLDEVDQIRRVLEFRRTVQARGALTAEFSELSDFEELTRRHLTLEVQNILRSREDHGNSPPAQNGLGDSGGYESAGAVLIRPTLSIFYRSDGWYVQNKGRGAALDILVAQKHVKGENRGQWFNPVRIPTLGPGEEMRLAWLGHENETGLGTAYRDEDSRPFTSVTGNDRTTVSREWGFPPFSEDAIRRHWELDGFRQTVSLDISYTTRRIVSARHEYRLQVIAHNKTAAVLRNWAVELRFPRSLLEPSGHYPIVGSASNSDTAVMRWTESEHSGPIYPDENREIVAIDYFMDSTLFQKRDTLFKQHVIVALFAADHRVARAEKAVDLLQKF